MARDIGDDVRVAPSNKTGSQMDELNNALSRLNSLTHSVFEAAEQINNTLVGAVPQPTDGAAEGVSAGKIDDITREINLRCISLEEAMDHLNRVRIAVN